MDLPTSIPIFEVMVQSQLIKKTGRKILNSGEIGRGIVKPILKRGWAVMFNLLGLVFGSAVIDKEIKDHPKFQDIRPFIDSISDIIDPKKAITDHPFIIGHYVVSQVNAWREERRKALTADLIALESNQDLHGQADRIQALKLEIENVQYQVPEKFRRQPGQPSIWDGYDDGNRVWQE